VSHAADFHSTAHAMLFEFPVEIAAAAVAKVPE